MKKWYRIVDYSWAILAIFVFIASIKYLNDGTLQTKVEALGLWAPLVIILLKISTLVFAPLGGLPIYVVSGAVFGTTKGFWICFLGDVIGSVLCFLISRKYGMRVVKFFAGAENINRIEKSINLLSNTKSFLKARITFATIPELVAYAAGLSKINFWKFFFINTPLLAPAVIIMVTVGDVLVRLGAKYTIVYTLGILILASLGIWLLSKDYRKVEGL